MVDGDQWEEYQINLAHKEILLHFLLGALGFIEVSASTRQSPNAFMMRNVGRIIEIIF